MLFNNKVPSLYQNYVANSTVDDHFDTTLDKTIKRDMGRRVVSEVWKNIPALWTILDKRTILFTVKQCVECKAGNCKICR